MKIFTCEQIRKLDSLTIEKEPIFSIDLMERASYQLYRWINSHFLGKGHFVVFVGQGNNGGDGLALSRMLYKAGYQIRVFLCSTTEKLSEDSKVNLDRLKKEGFKDLTICKKSLDLPKIKSNEIIIDALFGSGLSRPLKDFYKEIIQHINNSEKKELIAIDIPSGLFGEDNSQNDPEAIINADFTLSFQFPKLSFLFSENNSFVGKWQVLPIGLHQKAISETKTKFSLQQTQDIAFLAKTRGKFAHKGNFGHVLLIAGSLGKMGAAVLASKACLRSGCGLLTTHVPEKGYHIMQMTCPEAMVSVDYSTEYFSLTPDISLFNVIAIGPGIAKKEKTSSAFHELLDKVKSPMVIDADAINILASKPELISKIPENSILTPHPGEFERLTGKHDDSYSRIIAQSNFSKKYKLILVLKGAHTSISMPDGSIIFNTTGNPGMATAGSGDVLTGIIAGLLAQGFSPANSACGGVFIHGLAGDLALKEIGEKSLIASDIIKYLPMAYKLIEISEQ